MDRIKELRTLKNLQNDKMKGDLGDHFNLFHKQKKLSPERVYNLFKVIQVDNGKRKAQDSQRHFTLTTLSQLPWLVCLL
jgi:GDP-D-mannose dehydratase